MFSSGDLLFSHLYFCTILNSDCNKSPLNHIIKGKYKSLSDLYILNIKGELRLSIISLQKLLFFSSTFPPIKTFSFLCLIGKPKLGVSKNLDLLSSLNFLNFEAILSKASVQEFLGSNI